MNHAWMNHIHCSPYCFGHLPGIVTVEGTFACPCGWVDPRPETSLTFEEQKALLCVEATDYLGRSVRPHTLKILSEQKFVEEAFLDFEDRTKRSWVLTPKGQRSLNRILEQEMAYLFYDQGRFGPDPTKISA